MDFIEEDRLLVHRPAAREWVARHCRPEWCEEQETTGTHHNPTVHKLLAEHGFLGAGWPKEYGGSDVDPDLATAVLQEVAAFGLRLDGWVTTWMIGQTILHEGSEEMKRAIVPAALRGECVIVLGYTEPGSGSDVAAAKMRAVRDGEGWVLNGSKMFTSTAHMASHVILITRTNTDVPKHRGLTMFVIPLDLPGVDIQPIYTMGGQRTNATYYTDVVVPDSMRLGAVDAGWAVMRTALVFERGYGTGRSGPSLAQSTAAWAQTASSGDGTPVYESPGVKEMLARMSIADEASKLLGMQVAWVSATGGLPAVEGAYSKLFSSESSQTHHGQLLDLLGVEGLLKPGAAGAPLDGAVEHEFRNSVVGTIYGGTSEIMREIIAEKGLGLPRSRPVT